MLILICNQYYVYECLKNAAALVFVMLRSISNSYFNQSCFHSRNEDSFAISCHILLNFIGTGKILYDRTIEFLLLHDGCVKKKPTKK